MARYEKIKVSLFKFSVRCGDLLDVTPPPSEPVPWTPEEMRRILGWFRLAA